MCFLLCNNTLVTTGELMNNQIEYLYQLAQGGRSCGAMAEKELESLLGEDWEAKAEELCHE